VGARPLASGHRSTGDVPGASDSRYSASAWDAQLRNRRHVPMTWTTDAPTTDERIGVRAFDQDVEFTYRLMKVLAVVEPVPARSPTLPCLFQRLNSQNPTIRPLPSL